MFRKRSVLDIIRFIFRYVNIYGFDRDISIQVKCTQYSTLQHTKSSKQACTTHYLSLLSLIPPCREIYHKYTQDHSNITYRIVNAEQHGAVGWRLYRVQHQLSNNSIVWVRLCVSVCLPGWECVTELRERPEVLLTASTGPLRLPQGGCNL